MDPRAEAVNGSVEDTTADEATRIERYYQDGTLYELAGTAMHPLRYVYGLEFIDGAWHPATTEIKVALGGCTNEWTKTYQDMIGRVYKTVYPDSAIQQSSFNNNGQLTQEKDPDGETMLYQYNGRGEREYSALDVDRNGVIDFGGVDRITRVAEGLSNMYPTKVLATETYT